MIHRKRRCGMSLLEVILAIAILGGALAVIGQLLRIGSRNAAMARDLTMAQLYCETKVNEILVGSIQPEAASDVELDEVSAKGEWLYKIETLGTETPGVLVVTVTVGQNPSVISRPVSYSISRMMIDPTMAEELAAQDTTIKQAFADAKTAAEGAMSGSIAYSPPVSGGAVGGAMGGGGGGGGGGGRTRNGGGGAQGGGPGGGFGQGQGPGQGQGQGQGQGGRDQGGRGRDGNDDGGRRGRGDNQDRQPTDRSRINPDRPQIGPDRPNRPPVGPDRQPMIRPK